MAQMIRYDPPATWPRRWKDLFDERLDILGGTDDAVDKAREDMLRIFKWEQRRKRTPSAIPPRLMSFKSWWEMQELERPFGRR